MKDKILNKKDPIDKKIIELVKNKELTIGIVKLKDIEMITKQDLDQFTGTEHYYKHFTGLKYTDGIKYLADKTNCYWFIDIIASYQMEEKVRNCPFQIWTLQLGVGGKASVTMKEDTNEPDKVSQVVEYTDFPLAEIEVYCINGVILLKSEY